MIKYQMDAFIYQNMLTCIGNKRKLIPKIFEIVSDVKDNILEKDKIVFCDGFAGSSVVSRGLSSICNKMYLNDMEYYAYLMAKCFMSKPNDIQVEKIKLHIHNMNEIAENGPYIEGIICENYAPKNTTDIKPNERCFYTRENALIIDTLRQYIEENVDEELFPYCITPLLIKASINTNTSGVFKGFHKNKGIGCFGGKGKNALSRILKNIVLECPIWSDEIIESECYNGNINDIIKIVNNDIDILYLDPPYNQHPYGSNYFMLNIIALNKITDNISSISGIPKNWNKSDFNSRESAINAINELLEEGLKKAKYILLSYNNEGIIKLSDWDIIFKKYVVKKYEIKYDAYKGSRNLQNRNIKVIEIMYLISVLEE